MTCIFFVGGGGGECGQSGWWIWRVWGGVVVCGGEGGSVVGVLRGVGRKGAEKRGSGFPVKGKNDLYFFLWGAEEAERVVDLESVGGCGCLWGRGRKCGWGAEEVLGGKGGKEGGRVFPVKGKNDLYFCGGRRRRVRAERVVDLESVGGVVVCGGEGGSVVGVLREVLGGKGGKEGGQWEKGGFFENTANRGGGGECGQSGVVDLESVGVWLFVGERAEKAKIQGFPVKGKNDLYFLWGAEGRRVRAEQVVDLESVGGVVVCGERGRVVGVLRECWEERAEKRGSTFPPRGPDILPRSLFSRPHTKFLKAKIQVPGKSGVVDLESVGGVVVCGGEGGSVVGVLRGVGRKGAEKRGVGGKKGGFFENTANSIFPKNLPRPLRRSLPRPRHFAPLAFSRPHTKFLKAKIQGFPGQGKNDLYFLWGRRRRVRAERVVDLESVGGFPVKGKMTCIFCEGAERRECGQEQVVDLESVGGVVVCGGEGGSVTFPPAAPTFCPARFFPALTPNFEGENTGFFPVKGKNDLYFLWGAEEASAGRAGGGFGVWGGKNDLYFFFCGGAEGGGAGRASGGFGECGGCGCLWGRGRKCGWGAERSLGGKERKRGGQWEKGDFENTANGGECGQSGWWIWRVWGVWLFVGRGRKCGWGAEKVLGGKSGKEGVNVPSTRQDILPRSLFPRPHTKFLKAKIQGFPGQGGMTCIFFLWGAEASAGRAGGGFGECGGCGCLWGEGGSVVGVLRGVGRKGRKRGGQWEKGDF
ncbi:uncharacterized protein MONOS_18517 [Monocercomonoides exilis]|uniref:uncharacterized protein n=1 Tax=Monocercomonoides exilis TaxID=2049356 RepID=UPI00355A88AD|nr:hypothetical protein MONOS_18517 [Monocercomonoides exilis]